MAEPERKRVYRLVRTLTETYSYDPEEIKETFAESWAAWEASGRSFDDFVIETFEQHDGSQFADHFFHDDANPQVGVELEEGWDDD